MPQLLCVYESSRGPENADPHSKRSEGDTKVYCLSNKLLGVADADGPGTMPSSKKLDNITQGWNGSVKINRCVGKSHNQKGLLISQKITQLIRYAINRHFSEGAVNCLTPRALCHIVSAQVWGMIFSAPYFVISNRHIFHILTSLYWKYNIQSCLNWLFMGFSFFVIHKIMSCLITNDVFVSCFHHNAV